MISKDLCFLEGYVRLGKVRLTRLGGRALRLERERENEGEEDEKDRQRG